MKRIIAFLLSLALLLSGCAQTQPDLESNNTISTNGQATSNDVIAQQKSLSRNGF